MPLSIDRPILARSWWQTERRRRALAAERDHWVRAVGTLGWRDELLRRGWVRLAYSPWSTPAARARAARALAARAVWDRWAA